jgi:rhodanese-related sulfurtransferase
MSGVAAIDVIEARRQLDHAPAPRLIDVREKEEWDHCRIEGAELLPLSEWPEIIEGRFLNPTESILVYCHHGGRSARAVQFLTARGFEKAVNVEGGIDAWSQLIDPSVPRYQ